MQDNLIDIVLSLFKAIETGDIDALDRLFDADAVQVEMPNAMKAKGDRRDLARLKLDFARGAAILKSQRYELLDHIESGERLSARVLWQGIMAIPVGRLAAGDTMTVHSSMVFEFRNGRILQQINYDCFEPF